MDGYVYGFFRKFFDFMARMGGKDDVREEIVLAIKNIRSIVGEITHIPGYEKKISSLVQDDSCKAESIVVATLGRLFSVLGTFSLEGVSTTSLQKVYEQTQDTEKNIREFKGCLQNGESIDKEKLLFLLGELLFFLEVEGKRRNGKKHKDIISLVKTFFAA